jgi:hypothetical protein
MREMFVRILRDGNGRVLPSEAARLVAPLFGTSPVEVILSVGVSRHLSQPDTQRGTEGG